MAKKSDKKDPWSDITKDWLLRYMAIHEVIQGVHRKNRRGIDQIQTVINLTFWGFYNGLTLENWNIGSKVRDFLNFIIEIVKNRLKLGLNRLKCAKIVLRLVKSIEMC